MSILTRTSSAQSFYPCLRSCALHRESSGPPMIQFVSLERMTVRIRSFHKEYLSCPTRWKNSSEIVEPSKNTQRRRYDCRTLQLLHLCLQCCDRFLRIYVAAIDLLPIGVLHEGVHVFCRRCAVVHVIRALIHI